jgi:hypothetical protein
MLPGGLGKRTFVEYARTAYGVNITEQQAGELKALWLEEWREMQHFLKGTPDPLHPGMYIGHTITGRRKPNSLFTASLNYSFQGLASDCSKTAGWYLWMLDAPLVNFVHERNVTTVLQYAIVA